MSSVGSAVVDWHSHIWLPEHFGGDWGSELDGKYEHGPTDAGHPEAHRAAMAAAGVADCVVIAMVSDYLGWHVPNEFVAEYVETWEGHAIGVASVDPGRASAVAELREAVEGLGMQGLKLAPPYQNFHPHSPEAYAVYRAAEDLGLFVIFHQGAVSARRGVLEVAQPVLLDRVARDFPELPIVVAHLGQPWYHEVVPMLRKHPNMYADLSARCSRPVQLRSMLGLAHDYGVMDRLLWGSDFPVFDPAEHMRGLLAAAADADASGPSRSDLESLLAERPLDYAGIVRREGKRT